jgi:hypothetical protein
MVFTVTLEEAAGVTDAGVTDSFDEEPLPEETTEKTVELLASELLTRLKFEEPNETFVCADDDDDNDDDDGEVDEIDDGSCTVKLA